MSVMSRKERYRVDAEYRSIVNKANRDRYHRKMREPQYSKLCATRSRVNNARAAIAHHEARLAFFYSRIARDLKLIEKLKQTPANAGQVVM